MFRDLWESNAEWCNLICKGQKGVKCKKGVILSVRDKR